MLVMLIAAVLVFPQVEAGQTVAVVEAMKMQNSLKAERSGVIKSVLKKAGAALKVDEVIIEFE